MRCSERSRVVVRVALSDELLLSRLRIPKQTFSKRGPLTAAQKTSAGSTALCTCTLQRALMLTDSAGLPLWLSRILMIAQYKTSFR
jgi:hypothetical protein